jgi:hypothetical protein
MYFAISSVLAFVRDGWSRVTWLVPGFHPTPNVERMS